MIRQLDPWAHRETGWRPELAAVSETLLALSNGYLGIRGTLDEGQPASLPGTYLNGCYELRPLPQAERGYGEPELDQVLVDVTDGTRIRLIVDGEPLDIRTGSVLEHERALDIRAGTLERELHWRSPGGAEVRVRSRRLVSLEQREIAVIDYEVEPVSAAAAVTVHSELVAELDNRGRHDDPRSGAGLPLDTLEPRLATRGLSRALLVHRVRSSEQLLAAGMDHVLSGAEPGQATIEAEDSRARLTLTATPEPGSPLRIVKWLAYHHAAEGDSEQMATAVERSLDRATGLGFEALAARQRAILDRLWARADIVLEGDPEIQHALRYALFQLYTNTVCAAGHAIPAKGLTGPGYSGHTFWDTEAFLLPVLTQCAPESAREALRWRAAALPAARARASRLGLRGAAFPWRTITGEDCSGYLPAGTAAFHVNADIAHAVARYVDATGDVRFEREAGAPLLVETARLWASLGHHDERRGCFSIDGVTGPDEYSPLVDNNLYTNLMAQANLRAAAELVERLGPEAADVAADEVEAWRRAAHAMAIPFDEELGVHLQDEEFARHEHFDFAALSPAEYPLFLHVPYFELYRRQVVKQPDLVLAMALRPESFTLGEKRRNLAYYEAITVRDSSLSAGTLAVMAAEVGDVDLAYDYLAEAALLDHEDFERNTADGLHLAALAGGWLAVIEGLAGARQRGERLSFAPRLPDPLRRLSFPFAFRGRRLRVEITEKGARYRLQAGAPLEVFHWDERLLVAVDAPAEAPIPPQSPPPRLRQPPGRAPSRRGPRSTEIGAGRRANLEAVDRTVQESAKEGSK